MKYFAMIGDRQTGPFELHNVVREGVRPDTYVWCKGMPDWTMAKNVPDICRYFRQRLSGSLPASASDPIADMRAAQQLEQEELINMFPPQMRNYVRKSGVRLTKDNVPQPQKPMSSTLPILLYIISIILIMVGIFMM